MWNKDAEYDLGFYKLLNKILGIYPFDCQSILPTLRMCIVLSLNWFMIYELAADLTIGCGTIDETIEAAIGLISTSTSVAKIILPRIYWRKMKIIVESAVDDWSRNIDDAARKEMMKWVAIGRFIFIFEMVNLCMLITCTTIANFPTPVFTSSTDGNSNLSTRILPWGSGCWLPINISDEMFLLTYLIVCLQQFVGGLSNMGFDVSFFIIVGHICGQIEILTIDDAPDGSSGSFQSAIIQKKAHEKFINRHNHLLRVCTLLEETFHLVILVHMLLYLGMVTILLFATLIAWQQQNIFMLMQEVTSLVIVYIQLFVYCYAGERLTNQFENLRYKVYNTPWYNLPACSMSDINFILRKLNDPFYLTCGKFHRMSMDNFKNILKVTASYCSVMRLMFSD